MSTNLVASIAISLVIHTNWTDVIEQDNELGFLVTNHVAQIEYAGHKTNVVLLTELSGIAVWRPVLIWKSHGPAYTNYVPLWIETNIISTNFTVTNYLNLEVEK